MQMIIEWLLDLFGQFLPIWQIFYSIFLIQLFHHLGNSNSLVLKHLSDTRWASRLTLLAAMKSSYGSVIKFSEIVDENERNEQGAKAAGLLKETQNWDFLFNIYVLHAVSEKTDALNKTLQGRELYIATALEVAEFTIEQLKKAKIDESYFRTEIFDPAVEFRLNFQLASRHS